MPAHLTMVTVFDTKLLADGSPAAGTVALKLSNWAQVPADDTSIAFAEATAALDENGYFALTVPATDDADLAPAGLTYLVTERIVGAPPRSYYIEVPSAAAGTGVSLADVAAAVPGPALVEYALAADVAALRAQLLDWLNVKSYGAVGNNVADDTTAVDAAYAAGHALKLVDGRPRTIYFPAGVYKTTSALTGPRDHGTVSAGAGCFASRITNAASNVFELTGGGYLNTEWRGLGFTASAGHLFVPDTSNGFSNARFDKCDFLQNSSSKSYMRHHADADWINNTFRDCTFTHVASATVPGFDIVGSGGHFNNNKWEDCTVTRTGNYFAWIEETNASSYAGGNRFVNIIAEDCVGGFAVVLSGNQTLFDSVECWDLTSGTPSSNNTTKDWIRVGKSTGPASRSTEFNQVVRRGGVLGSGLVDVKLDSAGAAVSYFRECGTTSSGLSIDLGTNSTCNLAGCSTGTTLTNVSSTAFADTAIPGILFRASGTGSPEGAVTGIPGCVWIRTDGGSSTTMYIKVTGTGNTGWQAVPTAAATAVTGVVRSGAAVTSLLSALAGEGLVTDSTSGGTTTTASSATPTPNCDTTDLFALTALAADATFGAPTGTPVHGQRLLIRIKDDGTARALSWNSAYRVVGVTLPTTTVISKLIYVGCVWNATSSKWDVLAVNQEV